jgi:hypothetical protein
MSIGLGDLTTRANDRISSGDYAGAQELLGSALADADPSPAHATDDTAEAAALLAKVHVALGDPHAARGWSSYAYAAATRLYGVHDARTTDAAITFAAVLHRVGSQERAARLYSDAIIELSAAEGPESPRVLAAHADLATVEYARGDCAAARTRLEDAWELHREVYGEGQPAGIRMLAKLGAMERDCGRYTKSHQHFALAQELCRTRLAPDHPLVTRLAALPRAAPDPDHQCAVEDSEGLVAEAGTPTPRSPYVNGAVPHQREPSDAARHAAPEPAPPTEVYDERPDLLDAYASEPYSPAADPAWPPPEDDPTWAEADDRAAGAGRYADRTDHPDAAREPMPEPMTEPFPEPEPRRAAEPEPHQAAEPVAAPMPHPEPAVEPVVEIPRVGPEHLPPEWETEQRIFSPQGGTSPGAALARRPPPPSGPAETLPAPYVPPPPRRLLPVVVAGVLIVLLGAAAVIAGFALVDEQRPPATGDTRPPATTTAPPAAATRAPTPPPPAAPGTPPGRVTLADAGDSVTLRWTYPAGAEGPVVVSAGQAAQPPRAIQELPAGTASYVVYGLPPGTDYCFVVSVVYSTQTIGRAAPVCTKR